jgi:universal stress protein E
MDHAPRVILAATDFSERAEHAVERAGRLAKQHDARLHLLHVHADVMAVPAWDAPGAVAVFDDSRLLAALTERVQAQAAPLVQRHGLTVETAVESGAVHQRVHAHAREIGADMIVIGSTGSGAIARRIFGSSAQSIVRTARLPVLVVRQPADRDYARLLLATDFSEDAERAARAALALAPKATTTLFAGLDLPHLKVEPFIGLDEIERAQRLDEARDHARKGLHDLAVRLGHEAGAILVRDGRASHELPDLASEVEADLIAIGAHGKSRLEAGLLGSTSQHVIGEAPCDVLVAPASANLRNGT